MSRPDEIPAEQPQVTTAPARSGWAALPRHLGRARTSTVILSVLFLAIGALYLNVRPDPVAPATTGGGGTVEQPVGPTTTVAPTTEAPATTTETAEPTDPEPTTTEPTTEAPEETAPTTDDVPTSPRTTVEPLPPTTTPTG